MINKCKTIPLLLAVLGGCATDNPKHEAGTPNELKIVQSQTARNAVANPEEPVRSVKRIRYLEMESYYEIYVDDKDAYIVMERAGGAPGYRLIGLTTNDDLFIPSTGKNRCNKAQCIVQLFKGRAHQNTGQKFSEYDDIPSAKPFKATLTNENLLADIEITQTNGVINVKVTNFSHLLGEWDRIYSQASSSKDPGQLYDFVKKYPRSPRALEAGKQLFDMQFKVRVASSRETPDRQITEKGLLASMAGACRDFSKKIEIKPNSTLIGDYSVQVAFVLNRFYAPHHLQSKDDPIQIVRNYNLAKGTNYPVTDEIKFECVLTSGKFYSAATSLLTKVAGAKEKDSGIKVSLGKTKFSYVVQAVK